MIARVLSHITTQLNEYLNVRSPALNQQRATVGSLVDFAGAPSQASRNRLVVCLANIEENRVYRSIETYRAGPDGVNERVNPELQLNLHVLFAANFDAYDEALKLISAVACFFQQFVSFTVADVIDDRARCLAVELESLTFEQQNHLWAGLGAKYVPSLLYRIGILGIRDPHVRARVPGLREIALEE